MDNATDGEMVELRQEVEGLQELVDQLSSDLQSALIVIEVLSRSTADSFEDFESHLEEMAEDLAESRRGVDEVKGLATDAKTSADDAKDAVEEANTIASQVKDDVDDALADAQKALNSSNTNKIPLYFAIVISVVSVAISLFGPFQITRKLL